MAAKKKYSKIAYKYADDVFSGKLPACESVMFACKRHLEDLEKSKSKDYPFYFSAKQADRRCGFSENFKHVKGKWADKQLELQPHQIFIQCAIWGWLKKKNDFRRFNIAYIEVPRKNGKSVDAATAGLYMLTADGEHGAEIYSGASTEKQALEVFRPAWLMANKSGAFRNHYGVLLSGTAKNPTSLYLEDLSRFELLVGNPGDGASPHCAIIDEFHEHKNSDQYDTMETGMGSREQPLVFVITTAGINTSTPCYELHDRAIKVLNGSIEDDALFAIIYTIDKEADWSDFEIWKAANPNYGVSIEEDYLRRKYNETMTNAAKQNINLCKHLNVWTNAGIAWMNMVKWGFCIDETLKLEDFKGMSCYAAFDLASKIDICALVLVFQVGDMICVFGKYYLPEETVKEPGNEHYDKWVKEGYITETSGARTVCRYIEDDLKQMHADFNVIEMAYDPKEATYLVNNIMEWYDPERCIDMNPGPALISEPMKELEALVYSQKLKTNGDPVLTWMMGNVIKKQGRNSGPVKYYYPTKDRDESKIDGAVALIMAIGRLKLDLGYNSVYDGLTVEELKERMAI